MPALALPGLRHKVEPRVLGAESQCKTRFFYFNYVIKYICCQGRKTDIARQSHLMLQGACRAQLCFKEEFAEHF